MHQIERTISCLQHKTAMVLRNKERGANLELSAFCHIAHFCLSSRLSRLSLLIYIMYTTANLKILLTLNVQCFDSFRELVNAFSCTSNYTRNERDVYGFGYIISHYNDA